MTMLHNIARRLRRRAEYMLGFSDPNGTWENSETLSRRRYNSYQAYLRHQRAKLDRLLAGEDRMSSYDVEFRAALRERLGKSASVTPGMNALCLAARMGTEVKAFFDVGCFALGIDLNPGPHNKYVVTGDFHELQFPDRIVDLVFTNSLDHLQDLDRLTGEVCRILKPGGTFIVEAQRGTREGYKPGGYESFTWAHVDDLVALLKGRFFIKDRYAIQVPWMGEHLTLGVSPHG